MPYANHKAETYSTTQKIVDSNDNTEESQTQKEESKRKGKEQGELHDSQKRRNKMEISTYPSITIFSVSELNSPVKRHWVAEWKKKVRYLCAAYKRLISDAKTQTTQTWRDGKNVFCENGNLMKVGVSRLTSDKIDFKTK